jgi:hypothetical protein
VPRYVHAHGCSAEHPNVSRRSAALSSKPMKLLDYYGRYAAIPGSLPVRKTAAFHWVLAEAIQVPGFTAPDRPDDSGRAATHQGQHRSGNRASRRTASYYRGSALHRL